MPDDPMNLFLQCYGEYIDAKEGNHPLMAWLKAVHCRTQLQKIGDVGDSPSNELQNFQDIFRAFVTEKKAKEIYLGLTKERTPGRSPR